MSNTDPRVEDNRNNPHKCINIEHLKQVRDFNQGDAPYPEKQVRLQEIFAKAKVCSDCHRSVLIILGK